MKKTHVITVVAAMLATLALTSAAFAQPPESTTYTYPDLECDDGVSRTFHVAGSIRAWDGDGDGYLIRSAEQTLLIDGQEFGPYTRSWGKGADSEGAITCTGGDFELQGFTITHVELVVVPVP
jgi:hypothetical protein